MAVVDELVTILGIKLAADALGKLKGFSDSVQSVTKSVAGLGMVMTGLAATAGYFINNAVNEAAELQKLSDKTGLSTDALQEWGYAATKAGGNAKAVQGDLQMLSQKFMTTGANAEKRLLAMADGFSKLNAQQAQMRGKAYGLSDDTILLLRKGREGIEQLRKEAHKLGGVIPQDAIKRAATFKKNLAELQFAIKGLTNQVALATVPALEKVTAAFKEFLEINREWIAIGLEALFVGIVQGFDRFLSVLKQTAGMFDPLIEGIQQFLPEMSGAEFVTHLVTGALTGMAFLLTPLIAKVLLIGAAVTAASMIFEDFFTYLEGGDSVIGSLFDAFQERWPALFDALQKFGSWIKEKVIDGLSSAAEVAKYVIGAWGELFAAILDGLNSAAGPIADFFGTFEEKFPALAAALSAFAETVQSVLVAAFDGLLAALKAVVEGLFVLLDVVGSAISKVASWGNGIAEKLGFGSKDNTPPLPDVTAAQSTVQAASEKGSRTGNSGGNSTVQNNDNKTVTINVATNDPAQAANQTMDAINQSNINTPGQYASNLGT